ncbi:MAG: Signal transduction histidine-protein kinase/phosphatase DegS [Syntrophorhabdus sp. PtaB.Bin006]|nr:MAG: Signal transduction histidine-protein kinase/phosphatase DegS [Syntrophorhabdus sp. PtaB.Bin006]
MNKRQEIDNKTKILVIDDDPELLTLTTMVLRRAGYEVLEASTGKEGLEAVRADRPDLVLLDVVLPDISGTEVCRQIKEYQDLKNVFVILSSGVAISSEFQADGLNTGADGFIVKPISNKELLARVQSMVRIKKAEEALQASETRYRRLFETAQDGILILSEETGQIDDVNPFLTDMLGYTHEELTGKKLWEIGAFKNTEASKSVLSELQHKGYVRYEDLPLITKDGREIDVEFVSNVYLVNHHKVIQCNIRDITVRRLAETELRRSQKLFHTIARVSPVGLFRTDSEGQYIYVNECWSDITGLSPDKTYGEGWVKALCPADKERILDEWYRAVKGDLPFESEFCFQQQSGIKKWVIAKAIAERGVHGERLGYVGTITDITERKRMEVELQKAHDQLEKRVVERTAQLIELNTSLEQEIAQRISVGEQLKESRERLRNLTKHLQKTREQERTFLSRELHDELGQVLTGMKMDIRWIERRLPEGSALILERLHSIIMLIDDAILSVQRISMALRPPALDDFGLSEAIKLALESFEKKTNISCKFISTPQQIVLNREISTEIFRIFQEAFTNITRHADAKNITVLLRNSGDKLIMEIRDDGRGITKKEIMDHKSIGLTGMRERAYAMEGNLAIIGVRGQGTIVTLSVPLNEGNEKETKTIKRGPEKAPMEA